MTTVNMHEAKSQLSKLVERACQGEDVIIARNGKPTARLVPVEGDTKPKGLRPVGLDAGKGWVGDDFNDPMPDDFMKAFGSEASARYMHPPLADDGTGQGFDEGAWRFSRTG